MTVVIVSFSSSKQLIKILTFQHYFYFAEYYNSVHICINRIDESRTARSDKNTNSCPKTLVVMPNLAVLLFSIVFKSRKTRFDILTMYTRNSAIAEGPRDASCQLKSCQRPRNSAETTCTTCAEQIEVMKLEGYRGPMCNKHVHSTMTLSSHFRCFIGVINKPTT